MEQLWTQLALQSINGFVLGMNLALIASGLALIFGVMDVVNFAHGEFYMLGAYLTWLIMQFIPSFALNLVVAPIIVSALGIVILYALLKSVLGKKAIYTLLATYGIGMALRELVLIFFGGTSKSIQPPIETKITILTMEYSLYRFFILICSLLVIVGLWLFLKKSKYGLWIRATAQDHEMAAAIGISRPLIYAIVFGVGSGMASIAGILMAPLTTVYHTMGIDILLLAFIIVVVGGMGSLKGALIASLLIGEVQAVGSIFIKPTYAFILCQILLMVILLVRPQGILEKR